MAGNKSGAGLLTTFILKPGVATNGLPKRGAASAVKGWQSVGQIGVASLRQAGPHGLATRGHGAAGNSSVHSPALGQIYSFCALLGGSTYGTGLIIECTDVVEIGKGRWAR